MLDVGRLRPISTYCGVALNQGKYGSCIINFGYPSTGVNDYSEVFAVEGTGLICKVKVRVIQEMIRPFRRGGGTLFP